MDDFLRSLDEPPEETRDEEGDSSTARDETNAEEEASAREPRDDERLGTAPIDNSEAFLRTATVLLAPGSMQFDHGLEYSVSVTRAPTFQADGTLSTERLRSRQWIIPFAVRYGIKEHVQGFLDIPFGYALIEQENEDFDEFANTFGIGDIGIGTSILLNHDKKKDSQPDLIGSLSLSIPTGDNPFGIGANDPALGTGFWGLSANLNAVQSYDPVVVFASVGYSHFFGRTYFGNHIQLGETISYGFGAGMAINDEITLSTSLSGSYQFDTQVDGVRFPRTSFEPISLRMALTGTMFKCHIVEPFVRFGLTDDATDVNFGLNITRL